MFPLVKHYAAFLSTNANGPRAYAGVINAGKANIVALPSRAHELDASTTNNERQAGSARTSSQAHTRDACVLWAGLPALSVLCYVAHTEISLCSLFVSADSAD